jgi:hypothetical protein
MHLKSRVILGAATAAAAIGAALVPSTSAFAATPTVTVDWASKAAGFGLQDGDTATVTGTGFPASSPVIVVECSAAADPASCSAGSANTSQTTDASGNFTLTGYVIHTGAIGNGTCGAGGTCYVNATTNPNAPDATNTAGAAIALDRLQIAPRTGLKNGQLVNITGGGFSPNGTVYISECTSADPSKATQACDFNHIKTVPTDGNGAFATTTFQVHTGVVGSDGSTCNPGGSCIVAGTDNVLNPANGHLGGSTVMFAQVKPLGVTAKSSVGHVAKGKTFKVTGKATSAGAGVAGLNAVLDKVVNGSLQKVAGAKTASGGSLVFKVTQKKTTVYKIVIASQKGYAAAASKTVKVKTP